MTKQKFTVKGMHCVGCAMTIDGALEDMAAVRSATTNYARQVVEVEYDEKRLTPEEIMAAIKAAGYTAQPAEEPARR